MPCVLDAAGPDGGGTELEPDGFGGGGVDKNLLLEVALYWNLVAEILPKR